MHYNSLKVAFDGLSALKLSLHCDRFPGVPMHRGCPGHHSAGKKQKKGSNTDVLFSFSVSLGSQVKPLLITKWWNILLIIHCIIRWGQPHDPPVLQPSTIGCYQQGNQMFHFPVVPLLTKVHNERIYYFIGFLKLFFKTRHPL